MEEDMICVTTCKSSGLPKDYIMLEWKEKIGEHRDLQILTASLFISLIILLYVIPDLLKDS
jgi:hypothetical protein